LIIGNGTKQKSNMFHIDLHAFLFLSFYFTLFFRFVFRHKSLNKYKMRRREGKNRFRHFVSMSLIYQVGRKETKCVKRRQFFNSFIVCLRYHDKESFNARENAIFHNVIRYKSINFQHKMSPYLNYFRHFLNVYHAISIYVVHSESPLKLLLGRST
jgi:hypothetical protein